MFVMNNIVVGPRREGGGDLIPTLDLLLASTCT